MRAVNHDRVKRGAGFSHVEGPGDIFVLLGVVHVAVHSISELWSELGVCIAYTEMGTEAPCAKSKRERRKGAPPYLSVPGKI